MKYCSKCGNQMEDDMIFCQKCGTKFVGVVSDNQSEIQIQLAKMKKYNLVLDSHAITWEYLRDDGERAGKICVKQDNLCEELIAVIKEILENTTYEDKDLVEREVYTFVLKMGIRMCNEGAKMFSNYAGFKELFDTGDNLVRSGQLNPATFLDQMIKCDYVYKAVSGLQGLHSARIKDALDADTISNNLEYQNLTKQLAQAFNQMWYACIKRFEDFFACPGQEFINQNWDCYLTILKGLPVSVIDTLDENGWMIALDTEEKENNDAQYKRTFLRNREQYKNSLRAAEEERKDKEYWRSHPDKYQVFEENNTKIVEIKTSIDAVEKDIRVIESNMRQLQAAKTNIERVTSENQRKIEKLKNKIFGKKKAEEEIKLLYNELNNLNGELMNAQKRIEDAAQPLTEKRQIKNNLEAEVQLLQKENTRLRNG